MPSRQLVEDKDFLSALKEGDFIVDSESGMWYQFDSVVWRRHDGVVWPRPSATDVHTPDGAVMITRVDPNPGWDSDIVELNAFNLRFRRPTKNEIRARARHLLREK